MNQSLGLVKFYTIKSEFFSIFCSNGKAEMLFQFDPKRIWSKVILICSFTSEPKPILYFNIFAPLAL